MMRVCFVLLWCLGFAFTPTVQAVEFPLPEAVPFLGMEGSAKALKTVVSAIQVAGNQVNEDKKDDWESLGTGFLVSGERNTVLAVTCEHVIRRPLRAKQQIYIGLDTETGYQRFPGKVVFMDPRIDIAILIPQHSLSEAIILQSKVFDRDLFDDGSSLVEGRGVLIPGYPLSLGVEGDQNHPVVRFGIVAQFTGKDHFLLDGVASHGNSGSPVFALKHKENRLIGMITSYMPDTINLFNEKGELTARLPYNSGLAKGVTSKVILAAIQKAKY